jgi:putative transcriptional regulator
MSKFGQDLVEALSEALRFAQGETTGARVTVVQVPIVPDVRAIRRNLKMSQQRFADTFHIPLPTLKNWEQGRRAPDAPAAAYLRVIARNPQAIQEALQPR